MISQNSNLPIWPVLYEVSEIEAGSKLFGALGCNACHQKPTYTSPELQQVGIKDELGREEFNPPSLIGVGQRSRFFHDGRFHRLREVFTENRHQLNRELKEKELDQLLLFLQSL